MDPLSDVLSLLKPQSYLLRGLAAGGQWSFQIPASDGIRCCAIVSGQCWLAVESTTDPIRLQSGDCILLTGKNGGRLASDLALKPHDGNVLFSAVSDGGVAINNGGEEVTGIGGFFKFVGRHTSVLLDQLPPVVHVREKPANAAPFAELAMSELAKHQPGGFLVVQHLLQTMLVLVLRAHLATGSAAGVGWLTALADRQLAASINAMHDDPARAWTLVTLAERACMSRSVFSHSFRRSVGKTPMEYLTQWRMMLAGHKLQNSSDSLSSIARSIGYLSDSAFSTAFKKAMGSSPRGYIHHQGGADSPGDALP